MPKGDKLSNQMQAFVDAYAIEGTETCNNATKAYAKAYPNCNSGHAVNAHKLLIKPKIIEALKLRRAEKAEIVDVTVAEIVAELRALAFDHADNADKPIKVRSLELLGRHKAMFTDNITNSVPDQSKVLTKTEQEQALRKQIKLLDEADEAGTAVAG